MLSRLEKVIVAVLLLLGAGGGVAVYGYRTTPTPYAQIPVVVTSPALDSLSRAYDVYRNGSSAPEYGYCVSSYKVQMLPDSSPLIQIDSVFRAVSDSATPEAVYYSCGPFPSIHSHPPTDCKRQRGNFWTCELAKDTTDLCEPSETDVKDAIPEWHRFHGVQCGKRRFYFFVPEYR